MASRQGFGLRVQVVVHVEDGKLHFAKLFESIRRETVVEHHLRAGEDHGVGRFHGTTDFRCQEAAQEFGFPVLLRQVFEVHGAQAQLAQGVAQGREIDLRSLLLAVHHALRLHIEGDDREPPDAGVAGDVPEDRDQRIAVERLQGGRRRNPAGRN